VCWRIGDQRPALIFKPDIARQDDFAAIHGQTVEGADGSLVFRRVLQAEAVGTFQRHHTATGRGRSLIGQCSSRSQVKLGVLCIQKTKVRIELEIVGCLPDCLEFKPLNLGFRNVEARKANARNGGTNLKTFILVEEIGGIEPNRIVEQIGFGADFEALECFLVHRQGRWLSS